MDTLETWWIHVLDGTEWESVEFHNATEDGINYKTYSLFHSEIFHPIFSSKLDYR